MLGRHHLMRTGFLSGALWGEAKREEVEHRAQVEEIIDLLELEAHRHRRRGCCPTACRSASSLGGRWPWSPACCCSTSPWRA